MSERSQDSIENQIKVFAYILRQESQYEISVLLQQGMSSSMTTPASAHRKSTSIRPRLSKQIGNSMLRPNRPFVPGNVSSRRNRNASLALLARSLPSAAYEERAAWTKRFARG